MTTPKNLEKLINGINYDLNMRVDRTIGGGKMYGKDLNIVRQYDTPLSVSLLIGRSLDEISKEYELTSVV